MVLKSHSLPVVVALAALISSPVSAHQVQEKPAVYDLFSWNRVPLNEIAPGAAELTANVRVKEKSCGIMFAEFYHDGSQTPLSLRVVDLPFSSVNAVKAVPENSNWLAVDVQGFDSPEYFYVGQRASEAKEALMAERYKCSGRTYDFEPGIYQMDLTTTGQAQPTSTSSTLEIGRPITLRPKDFKRTGSESRTEKRRFQATLRTNGQKTISLRFQTDDLKQRNPSPPNVRITHLPSNLPIEPAPHDVAFSNYGAVYGTEAQDYSLVYDLPAAGAYSVSIYYGEDYCTRVGSPFGGGSCRTYEPAEPPVLKVTASER